jgi:hypothetical protein
LRSFRSKKILKKNKISFRKDELVKWRKSTTRKYETTKIRKNNWSSKNELKKISSLFSVTKIINHLKRKKHWRLFKEIYE